MNFFSFVNKLKMNNFVWVAPFLTCDYPPLPNLPLSALPSFMRLSTSLPYLPLSALPSLPATIRPPSLPATVRRIYDPVVPESGGGEVRTSLRLEPFNDGSFQRRLLLCSPLDRK